MRPVIVHGGGAAISKEMDTAGIAPEFIHGRRVTNDQTLEIVEKVLAGDVNRRLAELIEEVGGRSMTLNFESTPVLFGEKTTVRVSDEDVDLGWVGRVTDIDRVVIENLCYAETVPVIPSMCIDDDGQKYNVNADTAATVVAQLLGAEKLVFLSDVNGVLLDEDDESSRIESLTADRARELISNGTITGGMIPKVEACLETLDRGVGKVHIIDGSIRHSVLLEVYTTDGIGTQIVKQ